MTPFDTRQTCARCGHVGYDVRTTIVEREPSEDDPTPYRAEARCINRELCDERTEADS